MAAFTSGDLVVERVGAVGGAAALSGNATAVFLDEYTPTGALVQSIAMPTTTVGNQDVLTASGTATSEGLLTTSADGRYLLLTGYDAPVGTLSVTGTTAAADPRVVGRVGADGVVDTSTVLMGFADKNNIRSVASADGTNIYVGGPTGIAYTTFGSTTAPSSLSSQNTRQIEVVGGQLYGDTSSGSTLRVFTVGSGLPTSGAPALTELNGVPPSGSPYGLVFAHEATTGTAIDTLYVADDTSATGAGITKYSLDNGVWTAHGSITGAFRGLTAAVNGGSVTLYATSTATSANMLVAVTDSSGFDGTLAGAPTTIATAAANTAFRGVAFAPAAAAPADSTPPTLQTATPANGATGVATNAALQLTFSEAIKLGAGAITLTDVTHASGSEQITASNESVSGATLTVTPPAALAAGDSYTLKLAQGAVTDLANNADAGETLSFTVAAAPGAIPTGPATSTYAITSAGAYSLGAAGYAETGAVTAISATVPGAALTSIDIAGPVTDTRGQVGLSAALGNGQVTIEAGGSITTLDGDAVREAALPNGAATQVNLTNLGAIRSTSDLGAPSATAGKQPSGDGLDFAKAVGASADHTSGGVIVNGSTTNATAIIESDTADAVALGSNETLTNYGVILGRGPVNATNATHNYASSRGVEINGGAHDTITNSGRIEGAQHGVDAGDAGDTDITVVNTGTIIGHNGSGVGSDGATANWVDATDVTVTNSGAIYGEYHPTFDRSGASTVNGDGDGVDIDGAGTVTNNVGGVIAGAGVGPNGAPVLNGQGAGGYDSGGRANHSEGLSLGGGVVENHGLISGADYGITVNNDGNANGSRSGVANTRITNESDGVIVGQNGYAIRLENKGDAGVDTDTIVNHGTITGGGAVPTGTVLLANGAADPNTVGMLNGATYTSAGDAGSARFIQGDGAVIQTGEGNDSLVNDGTITQTNAANGHAISLEGGDDSLTLSAAGTVTGLIDGGAGTDTLNLTAGMTGATANTLSGAVSFEMLDVQKGSWTLSDSETYTTGAIDAGATLQLGAGGTTGAFAGALVDSGTLAIDRSDAVTIDGSVSGGGVLSQIGSGVTTLSTIHQFASVTLKAGVLDVAVAGGAGTGALTFAGAAALHVETTGAFANTLYGFAAGDTLDAGGVGANATASFNASTHVLTVSGSGGADTFHLDPGQNLAGRVFQATSDHAGGVNITVAPLTIGAIQGASQTSPFVGQAVTTQGVVTAINGTSGYYIQSESGHTDNDANTSDAIYVFGAPAAGVKVGDLLSVSGTVTEYQPASGSTTANNLTTTELTSATANDLGGGHLIDTTLIGAGGREPPTALIASPGYATYDPSTYAADFYESVEGMVVTVKNAQAVDNTYSNETWVVPGGDAPTVNDRGGVTITPGVNGGPDNYAPERIEVYQSPTSALLPGVTLAYNQGAQLGDVTGVVSYYGGNYELLPTVAPASTAPGAPPADDVTTLVGDANHLTIGAYNVDNLGPVGSPTSSTNATPNPSDTQAKYNALGHDIAVNLHAPAILGLEEIQDADGQGSGANLSGATVLNQVTAAVTAAGGPAYSYVEVAPPTANTNGGVANGNIRSAFLYDPARVSLVAGSVRTFDDPSSPYTSPTGTFHNSREPLAADFTFNGQTITVIDVHQYSRGGSDELFGQDQPPFISGDARRTAQADAVLHYVQGLEHANPNAQILVEGDFNGFYFEKALTDLGQTDPDTGQPTLVNLVQTLSANERYSYNFEGDSEQLDNLLVTPNLVGGALFDDVHVNTGQLNLAATSADGSGAVSDHDPILAQLTIGSAPGGPPGAPPGGGGGGGGGTPPSGVTQTGGSTSGQLTGSAGGDSLTAGSAGDTLLGGDGADTLTTGSGHDQLFGNMGDDHVVVGAASLGATVFAGQGNDVVDASASTHANYISGDLGDDAITAGRAGDVVLGGGGADTLTAGAGHDQLFGNAGNDRIVVGPASQGASVYGGQGDDVVDGSRSNAPDYVSGDVGADTLLSGAGFETVLGGQGDDYVIGGATAGAGSMQMLFGNQGNDHLSYSGAGGVQLYGGQDSDVITITSTQAGQVRYAFGNLGTDTLTATGGADSLYGGQGDDVVSTADDTAGRNYLSGDLGDDVVIASRGGSDTVHGGQGADTLTLTAHAAASGDSVAVGAGDSTSSAATDESNVQHVFGFTSGSDHVVLAGHAALNVGAGGNLATCVGGAAASEAAAFSAAYTYAFGDGGADAAHIGATEYLAVQESYGSTSITYLFTADHHVVALSGVGAAGLRTGDVLAG